MADDDRTNSGSLPDPIPEVRDEGPGGTDLDSGSDDADGGGTDASDDVGPGHLPHPVRDGTTEGRPSRD
jgi:hypothetical protein